LLVVVLGATSIIHYWQVQGISDNVARLVETWEPLERNVFQMQSNIDKTATAIADYNSNADKATSRAAVIDLEFEFGTLKTKFSSLADTDQLKSLGQQIDELYEQFKESANNLISVDEPTQNQLEQFTQSYSSLGSYLDDEVQPVVNTQVLGVSDDVQSSVTSASVWLIILGIAGLFIGVASVWVISRNVTNPVRQLVDGAKRVASGRIDHRFNVDAKGEFGLIALALNQMLDNLGRSRDALAESEESAWALLDATSDAVILINTRGVIQASNELAAMRFGMSLEQMVDESLYDILPAEQAVKMRTHVAEAVRSGKSVRYEDEREAKIIDYNIFPVAGAKGEPTRLAVFSRDITIRKWVEDVTDQITRRNELILKSAGQGIYGLDVEGKATFVNPVAARMLGYDPEELTGQHHHELVHHSWPDGKPYPNEECPVHATLKDGTVRSNVDNEVFWRKDGRPFPVEYTSTPIIEENGKIAGAVVTFTDITDRKRLEKMLRQSEEMYRSFFQSSSSVIISVDKEGVIVDCNARIQQASGYSPAEVIGKKLLELVHPNEHLKIREYLDNALTKGFEYNNQFLMTRKDGSSFEVTMNAAAVRDAKGVYLRTICMIDEVSQSIESQLF